MRITALGAGYMGTAMACVAAQRGHEVSLWGTWLDDPMLDPVDRGEEHPKLLLHLPTSMRRFRADALAEALAGAEMVICGVNSDGIIAVLQKARAYLPQVPILSVTKGLLENEAKRMDRIDRVASQVLGREARMVHAAGPAKAMEIARGVLTWMCFGGADAEFCASAMAGAHLCVTTTDDIAGAELCSALKNAYATGLGMWDGHVGDAAHNARAACFAQAIGEMALLVSAAGGRPDTVYGTAGVGDLHVTAAAGRNRAFGERVGRGEPAGAVAKDMLEKGQLTEGYAAIATAMRFAKEHGVVKLPLLGAIHAVVWEGASVGPTLGALKFG